jgi:hypothetical protein
MALRSLDHKQRNLPLSITNCIRYPPSYPITNDLRKKYCIIGTWSKLSNASCIQQSASEEKVISMVLVKKNIHIPMSA